jgi:hypothetical protein
LQRLIRRRRISCIRPGVSQVRPRVKIVVVVIVVV